MLENREYERVGGTKPLKLNARIIAATNKDLEQEIKAGRFREDLFYRIHVINIPLPPLRERMEDLAPLISYFIKNLNVKFKKNIKSVSPAAIKLLSNYRWPGNIRELENVLEHAFVVCHKDMIDTEHIPERLWKSLETKTGNSKSNPIDTPLKDAEKQILLSNLQKYDGHRGQTAAALGIDKTTLWRKMKKFGLL